MRSFRDEIRVSLEARPTQSDLGALKLFTDRELYHMGLRVKALEEQVKEDARHRRNLIVSMGITALGALLSLGVAFLS